MKYALATAAFAALVSAQVDLGGLPECAQQCLPLDRLDSFGCSSPVDFACYCQNDSFIDGISCCVSQNCQGDEVSQALDFAGVICGDSGVQLPTEAGCTGAAASSASESAAPAASNSMSMTDAPSMSMTDAPSTTGTSSGTASSDATPPAPSSEGAGWHMAPAGGAAGFAAVIAALL